MNKLARLSGNPAATQRSQNPDTISISGVPASPACVSHADISVKNASFMLRVYRGRTVAMREERRSKQKSV